MRAAGLVPAGDLIAITSGRAGSLDIVLIDPEGREVRNLTKESRSAVMGPAARSLGYDVRLHDGSFEDWSRRDLRRSASCSTRC